MALACVSTILLKLDPEVTPIGPQEKCDAPAMPPKLQRLLVVIAMAALAVAIPVALGAPQNMRLYGRVFQNGRGF